ncbi:MAG: creatininase family protein [Thermomicrobiales bacterium]
MDRQQEAGSSGPLLLAEMTSAEIAALGDTVDLVLIPVGANEQHGVALPVSTDTISAQVLSALTATLVGPRVAVAPPIPWGVSWHHLDMPGTLSLREETLIAIVLDLVDSLARHGVKRVALMNGHGGNNPALAVAVDRAHRELGVPIVTSIYAYTLIANAAESVLGPEAIGHGGGDEASVVLALRPDLVRKELLTDPDVDPALRTMQQVIRAINGTFPVRQNLVSASGTTGDARNASAEAGNTILGQAAARLQTIVQGLIDLPVPVPPDAGRRAG